MNAIYRVIDLVPPSRPSILVTLIAACPRAASWTSSVICAEKSAALQHICEHLLTDGPRKWKSVRLKFPMLSERSFWRCVREAKKRMGEQNLAGTMEKSLCEYEMNDTGETIESSKGLGGLNYMVALRALYRDTLMLRARALNADESVRNPALLDRSIRTRLKLLAQAVRLERQIQDLRLRAEIL